MVCTYSLLRMRVLLLVFFKSTWVRDKRTCRQTDRQTEAKKFSNYLHHIISYVTLLHLSGHLTKSENRNKKVRIFLSVNNLENKMEQFHFLSFLTKLLRSQLFIHTKISHNDLQSIITIFAIFWKLFYLLQRCTKQKSKFEIKSFFSTGDVLEKVGVKTKNCFSLHLVIVFIYNIYKTAIPNLCVIFKIKLFPFHINSIVVGFISMHVRQVAECLTQWRSLLWSAEYFGLI